MIIVNLLILALLGAWMLQIAVAVCAAAYLIARPLRSVSRTRPQLPASAPPDTTRAASLPDRALGGAYAG